MTTNLPSKPDYFFFNDTPTPETYTLSLHDALPISASLSDAKNLKTAPRSQEGRAEKMVSMIGDQFPQERGAVQRSEEHTSELQSQSNLVCRLLLDKKSE